MPTDVRPYALMAELLDSLNVGVCLFDDGDHALVWNRAFLTLFPEHDGHIHPGEHYSANLRRFYLSRLSAEELPLIDRYIEEGIARHRGQSQPFVFQHRGQWVRVAATGTEGGGRIRVWTPLASPTGPSPWERTSVAGRPSSEDAYLEQVADGAMLLDADGRIVRVNEPVLFLYDLPRKADLIGLRYEELLHRVWQKEGKGDGARLSALLAERQRFPGSPFEVELPGDRWLRVAEQRGVDGTAYSTHVDITEMKRLQTALNRARETADGANAAKSRFLAMISHEIRTPMNAIIGIGRIALKSTADPALRGYLETINGSAGRLVGIINDLLDFSKIEAGKVEIAERPFALDEVLEPLCDLVAGSAAGAAGVEVVLSVAPGVPDRLVGDPLRLGQVLCNLTGNALKFTERGAIRIAVEEVARAGGRVTLGFQVADTGIGIDAARQARLFQPFVQADEGTVHRYGGTGLGLTICKQLVELMGGRIALASAPGQGSRFSFTVELGLAEDRSLPAPPGPILVVDDHPAARAALAAMVAALGAEAVEASSGPDAMRLAERAAARGRPFVAALVDWPSPGWDTRAAGVPVLALTPMAAGAPGVDAPPMDAAEPGGPVPDGVLFKPVSPGRLRERLAGLLGTGGAAVEPAARRDLSPLRGARLLLVDDNALNREVALHLLAEAEVAVDVAEDGAQALERVACGDYDLVLMDLQMPVMDGLEATRRIRRLERFRDLPIVAMTAQAMSSHRQASREAGLNEHLTKPIEPDRLFDSLLRLIDPARLAGRRPGSTAPISSRAATPDAAMGRAALDGEAAGWDAAARRAGLDWDSALRRVDGDAATLRRLMRSFCRDCAGYPAELREAAAAADHERIRFLAHALRSSSAYVGAMDLSRLAGRVEEAARHGQPGLADARADALADGLDGLLDRLSVLSSPSLSPSSAPAPPVSAASPAGTGAATDLEPLLRRLAERLGTADLRAEDVWGELRPRLGPAQGGFIAAFGTLLDDLRYDEALARLRVFAAERGLSLPPARPIPTARRETENIP